MLYICRVGKFDGELRITLGSLAIGIETAKLKYYFRLQHVMT